MKCRGLIAAALIAASGQLCATAQDLMNKDQIVHSFKDAQSDKTYELIWGKTASSSRELEVFVAVHRSTDDEPDYIAAIYHKLNNHFKRLKQIRSDLSYIHEPEFLWVKVQGTRARKHLINITETKYGTGNITTEYFYFIDANQKLIEVEFIPAPLGYKKHLGKGEGIWKSETNTFSDDTMEYRFYIWKEGDKECCPSGGKVRGTYTMQEENGKYRIVPGNFKRTTCKQGK